MELVHSNKKITNEQLMEAGAVKLANKLAREAELSLEELKKISETASTTLGFKVRGLYHQLSCDKHGLIYHMRNGGPFTYQITNKDIESFNNLNGAEKKRLIANLDAQYKTLENIWKGKVVDTLPKVTEKKPERETILFNLLIDGLMKKIPATTTTSDSITHNLWWSLASEVARVIVEDDKALEDIDIKDDTKAIFILDVDETLHQFALNKKGIIYGRREAGEGKQEEKSFKGYEEIVRDYMKKKTND